MSCPHGNPIGDCDICDEIDAAFEAGRQSALAEQPAPAQPLTVKEIAEFVGTHEYGPEQLKWFRFGEAAHGITKGGAA
jgi:hypothetical protein